MQSENAAGVVARNIAMLASGALLVATTYLIALISGGFYFDADPQRAPIITFTVLFLGAGAFYLCAAWIVPRLQPRHSIIAAMLIAGLLMRLILFDSYPVMEIDFYRYLWDGAVLANGFNPYALPPAQVPGSELGALSQQAGSVFERIGYRELSSIYPPLAQLAFAFAHWLDPWQADGLRLVFLSADILTMLLVLKLLKRFNRSPLWSCIYWWNPLLIVLTYNGLHMDVLLLPPLLLALLAMIDHRHLTASAALALAAGFKLWPLLLLPFALRGLPARPRELLRALTIVAVVTAVTVLPMLLFATLEHSGLAAFSRDWQRNSVLFAQFAGLLSLFSENAQLLARLLVAAFLVLLSCYLARRGSANPGGLVRGITITIAALFLLSPVQLPWYCLWFLPLLCLYPHPALLLLCALMPIYFLRFHFDFRGDAALFDHTIVWLQYLPPLLLLLALKGDRQVPTQPLPHRG